jgi:hypothetical protein
MENTTIYYQLHKYENLFVELDGAELYRLIDGEMIPIDNEAVITLKNCEACGS